MKLSSIQKRLTLVFVLVCFSVGSYGIIANNKKMQNKVAQVNATPITNKVIVLDAGHGLPDERCCWF